MNRLVTLLLALSIPAFAHDDDDDDHEERSEPNRHRRAPSRTDAGWAPYEQECGACHLAFSPSFLPGSSWKRLLARLDDHFGQNAVLDAPTQAALEAWLARNAAPETGPSPLRITETRWWKREHHELSAAIYKRASIGTAANCAACHPRANEGAFGEHEVRIPRDAPAPR